MGYGRPDVEWSDSWDNRDSAFRAQDAIDWLCLFMGLGRSQQSVCCSWGLSSTYPCPCSHPSAFPLPSMPFKEGLKVFSSPLELSFCVSDTSPLPNVCLPSYPYPYLGTRLAKSKLKMFSLASHKICPWCQSGAGTHASKICLGPTLGGPLFP